MPKQQKLKKMLPKLTESNYYDRSSDLAYMSVSQYKSFMKCEAETIARLKGEYEPQGNRTALLVGQFVDCAIEGTLSQFKQNNPEIYTKTSRKKFPDNPEKWELLSDFVKAEELVNLINKNELFMQFLSGEKQVILTFNMFNVDWKIKMDSFVRDICITDLKTARNTEGIVKWRYDIQGAIYQKGVELNGFGTLPFYLAVATKEDIPELNIFQIPQSTLDLALMEVEENLPHIMEVKTGKIAPTRCEKCDYCKRTRKTVEKCDYCKRTRKTVIRNYNELLG